MRILIQRYGSSRGHSPFVCQAGVYCGMKEHSTLLPVGKPVSCFWMAHEKLIMGTGVDTQLLFSWVDGNGRQARSRQDMCLTF